MKLVRLATVVLVGAAVAFGPSVASADAATNYNQQAKKQCKKKKGKAKKKCIRNVKRKLRLKDNPPATIRTTSYGIPRIVADSNRGIGFGYGYSIAKDNICTLADNYVTLRGERSKFFGPAGGNRNSDFVRKQIIVQGKVNRLLNKKGINAVNPGAREVVRGYVKGYNRYLANVGRDNIPDETCRGEEWVRPITERDVYLRFYELLGYAGTGQVTNQIAEAQPPSLTRIAPSSGKNSEPVLDIGQGEEEPLGSNAVGLGAEATSTGRGMLFGNPHFPWSGPLRMYQSQLTIPGKLNVSGASLFGVPMVMIGHTQKAAWSHTVSTARRFVLFKLTLADGNPTAYVEDGQEIPMSSNEVTVEVKQEDGSIETETRTLYSTKHGNLLSTYPGVPGGLPWTDENAYVIRDPNLDSFRVINHFYDVNRAQSVRAIEGILDRYQAIPWVNTIAADSQGNAFYGDVGVIPNVPDEKIQGPCGAAPFLWGARLPVLDGSDSECLLGNSPNAAAGSILPREANPRLTRQDYASNMNDSYWLANPEQPLDGYDRIVGEENLPRSLRTRNGLVQIAEQLGGGGSFELADVQAQLTNGFDYGAEALKAGVVQICDNAPVGTLFTESGTPVDVSGACAAIEGYGNTNTLDDPGALLWRRIMIRLPYTNSSGVYTGTLYATPFALGDPVNTPFGTNTELPEVGYAIAEAVKEFDDAGVDYDAALRDHQYVTRNGEQIPIPGGPGGLGIYNAINVGNSAYDPATISYTNVPSGSSFVIAASLNGAKCPPVRTILTYSQAATNTASPYYADQTRLFSNGGWVTDRFCKSQQLNDPDLKVRKLNGGSKQDGRGW